MKISKLCNLRCTYCYEYDELANKERMPLDRLAYFFEQVANHYVEAGWTSELRFVLHGGEPLLLPDEYLRAFVGLQRAFLGSRGVRYRNSLQTNLFHLDDKKLALLEELEVGLGVSIDVFGGERVSLTGNDSQERVLDNLQRLFDTGATQKLAVGLISVLHRKNLAQAAQIFAFCDRIGLSFRMLPLFSLSEPPERVRPLTIDPPEVVAALQAVADAQLSLEDGGNRITVYPLWNFFLSAVHYLGKRPAQIYDPRNAEWALIVNTNGDTYNHAEAYTPEGLMGNIFEQPLAAILGSAARERTLVLRDERAKVCEACPYSTSCSRVPVVEALPSERAYDESGKLVCAVTRPMIDFFVAKIAAHPEASALVAQALALPAAEGPDALTSELAS